MPYVTRDDDFGYPDAPSEAEEATNLSVTKRISMIRSLRGSLLPPRLNEFAAESLEWEAAKGGAVQCQDSEIRRIKFARP